MNEVASDAEKAGVALLYFIFLFQGLWAADFSKFGSDYSIESKKIIPAYKQKDLNAEKVGFLPKGSYIKNNYKEDPREWKSIRFAYIAARPECQRAHTDREISERLEQVFNSSLNTMKLDDYGIQINMRTILREYNLPEFCFKINQGFVSGASLAPPLQLTTEARNSSKLECADCKKESALKEAANNILSLLETKDTLVDNLPPPSEICGKPGRPEFIKLPTITIKAQWEKKLVETYVEAVNSKGVRYKKKALKHKWVCDISFPKGCDADDDNASLPKVVKIADFYVGKNKETCELALKSFYEECSIWKDKSIEERYKFVEQASRKTVSELKRQKKSEFSDNITPELLQCIAYRENHMLEPAKVNYTACQARVIPNKRYRKQLLEYLGDYEMLSWRSAANGLNQHRFETFKENWDKFLKTEKPIFYNNKNKTYAEIFDSAEDMFELLADYPELQIEKMARDLNFRYMKFNLEKCMKGNKKSRFDCTILSYDGDQSDTYLPAVKSCTACLNKNPKSMECLKKAHPEKPKHPIKRLNT